MHSPGRLQFVASLVFVACFAQLAAGYPYPSWYKCNPATCLLPSCHCPSASPPGGLAASDVPQFVLLTNDDAVDEEVTTWMAQLTHSLKNNNSCPIPTTWFTLVDGTSCGLVQRAWYRGDEIAAHTLTHSALDNDMSISTKRKEIVGSKDYLVKNCGIPAADLRGFRAPYLVTSPDVRAIVANDSFLYDSTTNWGMSKGDTDRTWPFTMDFGVPKAYCPPGDNFQSCTPEESYPGVWQVPLWELAYDGQVYTMDPGLGEGGASARAPYDVLKSNFDASYAGNRAPVPISLHVFWFSEERVTSTRSFMKYALSQPDVYFVTISQLLEWMQAPVPKDQMADWLGERCGGASGLAGPSAAPGPSPAPAPGAGAEEPSPELSWLNIGFRAAILGRRLRALVPS